MEAEGKSPTAAPSCSWPSRSAKDWPRPPSSAGSMASWSICPPRSPARTRSPSSPTRDPDGLYVMRHSTAHVLAQALRHLYGKSVQYTIGPVIENGFFYDFELPAGIFRRGIAQGRAGDAEAHRRQSAVFARGCRAGRRPGKSCTARISGSRMRSSTSWRRRGKRPFRFIARAISRTFAAGRTFRPPGKSRRSNS